MTQDLREVDSTMDRGNWEMTEEATLVIAAQAGDLAAFDRLAQRYRPAALTVAKQMLPAEAAEDAAQDALLAAFKSLPMLEDPERFAAWFGAIVRHRARRLGRERSKQPLALDQVIVAYAPSIVARLHDDQRSESVRCAVARLPPEVREPTDLHYLQGWAAAEIAQFLSLPLSTVKWRLHIARRLLRQKLAALEETQ